MNEAEFSECVEQTLVAIEEAIDESGLSLDYENAAGILTIFCEDSDSQVIVSRQTPLKQIWVAAKSGGYHCSREDEAWKCTTTGESLQVLLSRVCGEQSKNELELAW